MNKRNFFVKFFISLKKEGLVRTFKIILEVMFVSIKNKLGLVGRPIYFSSNLSHSSNNLIASSHFCFLYRLTALSHNGRSFLYVLGALGYTFKFPKLSPKVFSYHEVLHVLVSVAATIHFIVIYSII